MNTRSLRTLRLLLAALVLAMLSGCATGIPGMGLPGGGYGSYPGSGQGGREVVGTVEQFDPSSGRLILRSEGGYGGGTEVWLGRDTRAIYRGQEVDPRGLERGDGVRVQVQDDGRQLRARSIEVIRNVREGGGYGGAYPDTRGDPYGQTYGGGLEGAVRHVDLNRRVIELTRGGYTGSTERVFFDERTRFEFRGQQVRPEQLESGDIVRIQGRPSQSGLYADTVLVLQDARSR